MAKGKPEAEVLCLDRASLMMNGNTGLPPWPLYCTEPAGHEGDHAGTVTVEFTLKGTKTERISWPRRG